MSRNNPGAVKGGKVEVMELEEVEKEGKLVMLWLVEEEPLEKIVCRVVISSFSFSSFFLFLELEELGHAIQHCNRDQVVSQEFAGQGHTCMCLVPWLGSGLWRWLVTGYTTAGWTKRKAVVAPRFPLSKFEVGRVSYTGHSG